MAETSSISSSDRVPWRFLLPVVAGIALGCAALDPLITHGLAWCNPSFGATKVHRMFTEVHPQEVPILGSSRADGSYVPDLIHPDAWNYGIEETGYEVTRMMLERELAKPGNGPVIINFDHSFFLPYVPNIAHFIPEIRQPAVEACFSKRLRWYNHVPTLRYFGVTDEYLKAFISKYGTGTVQSRGGIFTKHALSPAELAELARLRNASPHAWVAHPKEEQAWLNLLASTRRTLVVVVAPYHPSYLRTDTNPEAVQRYLDRMDALPNVHVINLAAMPLPDSCFQNTTHVNWAGAVRFSKELRGQLNALGLLPNDNE
jgi:hypothetical protein